MISSKRRRDTAKVIKKRLKHLEGIKIQEGSYLDKLTKQPHRLAKRSSLGCNHSKCTNCHGDKLDDKIMETEI